MINQKYTILDETVKHIVQADCEILMTAIW